jgi:xanthine dehydrogenase molybdenum-binding subunit
MSLHVIGKSVAKKDAIEKVKGKAVYTGDMKLPGMLVGKVLRSPHAHAEIVKIDTGRAKALPGVKAVLTFEDTPKIKYNMAGFPPSGVFPLPEDQYILSEKARFVGDGIAAVAAVDEDTALEALKLIEVEYRVLPAVFDIESVLNGEGSQIHNESPELFDAQRNLVTQFTQPFVVGDVEKGFAEADLVLEETYSTHKVFHCSLEPCSVSIASYDDSGRLTVWSSTQMPYLVRRLLAQSLDMPIGMVRVIKPYVGGAFGSRLGMVNEPLAALLAKITKAPVKVEYDREESFLASEGRHPGLYKIKTGIKKDGTFTARQLIGWYDTGAYATHGPSQAAVQGAWFVGMYKCPNVNYQGTTVYTNTPLSGAYRGYGNPQIVFAVESHNDSLAEKLGIDPLEIRLKNHPCAGEIWPWTGWHIESCGLEEAIERGAKAIGWKEKRGVRQNGKIKRGVGMGFMMHVSGARPILHENAGAFIKMNEDGSVNVITGSTDVGQGSTTTLAQIVAEELGISYGDVHMSVAGTDTDTAPFDIGSHASRQAYSAGYAVQLAASKIKEQLLDQAAEMLKTAKEELVAEGGRVYIVADREQSLSYAQIATQAHFGEKGYQFLSAVSTQPPGDPPVYAAQFAEVEVDTETGIVKVVKMAAGHDVGRAINPRVVEGQIEGSLHHGIGYATIECMVLDKEKGRWLNGNFHDYKLMTAVDMPEIDSIVVEAPSKTGAFGVKSVGESGLVPTAAAIANAVYDAIGVRITDLPITPEKVLAALAEKEKMEEEAI